MWIPRLWGQTKSFHISLTVTSCNNNVALHDALSPYFHRLRSLSLDIPEKHFSEFFIAPPTPFEHLETLTLEFCQGIPSEWEGIPVEGPPRAVINTLPCLERVTLQSACTTFIEHLQSITLPWPQLTHITIVIKTWSADLVHIIRQCKTLVSFTFSPYDSGPLDPIFTTTIPELLLPDLQSLTWITSRWSSPSPIFALLRVPSMNEFSCQEMPEEDYCHSLLLQEESSLMSMLDRSQCRLHSLNLSSLLEGVEFKSILSVLPDLVSLIVCDKNPIPDIIFDMAIRGEVLQKLQHLECFVESPIPFLRLLEYQYNFQTADESSGLLSAKVSHGPPDTWDEDLEIDMICQKLRPHLANG